MADLLNLMELEVYTDVVLEGIAAGQHNFHFLFFVNESFLMIHKAYKDSMVEATYKDFFTPWKRLQLVLYNVKSYSGDLGKW